MWKKLSEAIVSQHAFSECPTPPRCIDEIDAPPPFIIIPSHNPAHSCSCHKFWREPSLLTASRRYTLLKGLELSKAAAHGLNKVLGDRHEKSREAKDLYVSTPIAHTGAP
jgi:hypothetical protein